MTLRQAVAAVVAALADQGRVLPPSRVPGLVLLLMDEAAAPPADREAEQVRELRIGAWLDRYSLPLPVLTARRERLQ